MSEKNPTLFCFSKRFINQNCGNVCFVGKRGMLNFEMSVTVYLFIKASVNAIYCKGNDGLPGFKGAMGPKGDQVFCCSNCKLRVKTFKNKARETAI